jgi:ferrous iron transport protein A
LVPSGEATLTRTFADVELRECADGDLVRIVAVRLDQATRRRLRELGMSAGARVRIVQRGAFGGRVVAVGADRFALDGRTCRALEVVPESALEWLPR